MKNSSWPVTTTCRCLYTSLPEVCPSCSIQLWCELAEAMGYGSGEGVFDTACIQGFPTSTPTQTVPAVLLTVLSTSFPSLPVVTFCWPTLVLIFHLIILFIHACTTFLFHYFPMVMVFTVVLNLYGITSLSFTLISSCKTRVDILNTAHAR